MQNIRKKLFELQKSVTTFCQTEESEKKANGNAGKSAYLYTPGWKITETIRTHMDRLGLMLEQQVTDETHEMLSYPVYKELNGQILTFQKKEMYVTLKTSFTWIDAETGEQVGPFTMVSSGANGTDKSMATALSMAERYFLLKYFHISTRDNVDEVDAHDSSNIPGGVMLPDAKEYRDAQGYEQAHEHDQRTPQQPQMPGYASAPQSQIPAQPQHTTQQQVPGNEIYERAVRELMHFGKGTQSHTVTLNKWLITLNQCGFETSNPIFATNLVETAQARREHRTPVLK